MFHVKHRKKPIIIGFFRMYNYSFNEYLFFFGKSEFHKVFVQPYLKKPVIIGVFG